MGGTVNPWLAEFDPQIRSQMKKECKIHGVTEFNNPTKGSPRCRKCNVEAVTRRRRLLKSKAVEYKGGKCEHCLQSFHQAVLEFHHKDPKEKDFSIGLSGITRSWECVKVELDKCLMLCANCHRIEHINLYEDKS